MGTDGLVTVAKTTPKLSRDAIRRLVVEVWKARGARVVSKAPPSSAVWRSDDQTRFAYAISHASRRGWVTLVESAQYGLGIDQEVLDALRAKTAVWVSWACDHAGMYGQKAFAKKPREPVDIAPASSFDSLLDYADEWDFVVLDGVRPLAFPSFAPSERTRSDPLPRDADAELDDELGRAIIRQDVEKALGLVEKLGPNVSDATLRTLFAATYPLQWEETRDAILTLGAAIARTRPLDAEHWARMLEVAAVAGDDAAATRAREALARDRAAPDALREALERLREARFTDAEKRFRRWTGLGSK